MQQCDEHCDLLKMVKDIHGALISDVDGKPGIVERMRVQESFKKFVEKWLGVIIAAGITSTIGAAITVIFTVHK